MAVDQDGQSRPQARPLGLEITETDDTIELRVKSNGARAAEVEFSLEVTGASTSRHKGKTKLAEGAETVLATVRVSKSPDWCARLEVAEAGETYVINDGACA